MHRRKMYRLTKIRKIILFAFFILLILIFFFLLSKFTGFSIKAMNKVESKVIEELEKKGKVRVIIKLKKERIKAYGIEEIAEALGKEKIKHKFSLTNSFSAVITKEDLVKLLKRSDVEKISYDYPVKAFLQQSASIVNATNVWNVAIEGINITGKGETVCIVDTGINYSHPSLGSCYGNNDASSSCKVLGGYDFVNSDEDPLDDNGHGTHVAGIVAANGSIKGIAPDAKLIAVKVLNQEGYGYVSDVIAGMEWCIANASKFNISVISLSLGCNETVDGYSDYCDTTNAFAGCSRKEFTEVINEAIAKNISVVAATGNFGWNNAIAAPACIKNATAVMATNKDDTIASYSNRNSIVDLAAPGTSINSTWLEGYALKSGTSMAAPHVSAAFALLYQFGKLQKRTFTPKEIESALNSTGKLIYDEATGLNFSRINVYAALLSLDFVAPKICLINPENNSKLFTTNITFSCNATDLQLKNLTLRIWNSTQLVYADTKEVDGSEYKAEWNVSLADNNYVWNCYGCDARNNCNNSGNFSLTITSLTISLVNPKNLTKTNSEAYNFTCNVTSYQFELSNITFLLWNSSNTLVYSKSKNISGVENETTFTLNFSSLGLKSDRYQWNCKATNNISYSKMASSNFTFIYDIVVPTITVKSPRNCSWLNKAEFNVSAEDKLSEISLCWFSLDNMENKSMEKQNESYFVYVNESIDETASVYGHNITFYCNDSAGNINKSNVIFFGIDKSKPNITLINPANNTKYVSNSKIVEFKFNVSDRINISYCKLVIDNSIKNSTEVNSTNASVSIVYTLTPKTYSWHISCVDEAGNEKNSSVMVLTIESVSSGSGTSTSSSASVTRKSTQKTVSYKVYDITEEIAKGTVKKEMKENESVKLVLNDTAYVIKLVTVASNFVRILFDNNYFKLGLNETKKIDLDNDSLEDISICVVQTNEGKATLTFKLLEKSEKETKPESNVTEISEEMNISEVIEEFPKLKSKLRLKLTISIIILLIFLAIVMVKFIKPEQLKIK